MVYISIKVAPNIENETICQGVAFNDEKTTNNTKAATDKAPPTMWIIPLVCVLVIIINTSYLLIIYKILIFSFIIPL